MAHRSGAGRGDQKRFTQTAKRVKNINVRPEWNKKCNGAKYSYHMRGMAADIRVDGISAKELAKKLNEIVPDECGCGIIVYKSWVHFDVRTGKKYRKGV